MNSFFCSINLEEVTRYFKNTLSSENENAGNGGKLDDRLQPIPSEIHGAVVRTDSKGLQSYENEGNLWIAESCCPVLGNGSFILLLIAVNHAPLCNYNLYTRDLTTAICCRENAASSMFFNVVFFFCEINFLLWLMQECQTHHISWW